MRVLVTGGAGFIGSHVVDALVAAGHSVSVVDNLSTGRRSNLNPRAAFYEVDLRDADGLRRVFERERPEVVDHHAAQLDVRRSIADPLYDASVNVLGGLTMLNLAVEFGTRKVIFISSGGALYGDAAILPTDEQQPIQPECPYAVTKYAMELYLQVYQHVHGLQTSILRYPNVYGPRQDPWGEGGVVAIFIQRMLNHQAVTIYGDGEQVRDYVYVGDCARANGLLLTEGDGQVYNLGSGRGTSVNTLFTALKAICGGDQNAQYAAARPGEIMRSCLNAEKARAALGWQPQVALPDGLARTVAYFRAEEMRRE